MRLDEKARENLEAAERLLPDDEGGEPEPLLNAAASRAYYAAYLAVADQAQQIGEAFTRDGAWYSPRTLPGDAVGWGILDWDEREALEMLRNWRIKADYHEDQVDLVEASQALDYARLFVKKLGESA